ncbi:MAG: hypothetical protein ACOX1P_15630 [Thermoguttaceae bacterium]
MGQLDLDGAFPCLVLNAADEKNREGNTIPLRSDLAEDLREWLAEKANAAQGRATIPFAKGDGAPPAATRTLPADTPVFRVPRDLVRILDRDLRLAGIPKRDERGRTVDVHAMRHTFGTWLSKGRGRPADGSSRDASLRREPDDERLHRPEAPERRRRYGGPAGSAARRRARPGRRHDGSDGDG